MFRQPPLKTYQRKKTSTAVPRSHPLTIVREDIIVNNESNCTDISASEDKDLEYDPFDTTFDRLARDTKLPPEPPGGINTSSYSSNSSNSSNINDSSSDSENSESLANSLPFTNPKPLSRIYGTKKQKLSKQVETMAVKKKEQQLEASISRNDTSEGENETPNVGEKKIENIHLKKKNLKRSSIRKLKMRGKAEEKRLLPSYKGRRSRNQNTSAKCKECRVTLTRLPSLPDEKYLSDLRKETNTSPSEQCIEGSATSECPSVLAQETFTKELSEDSRGKKKAITFQNPTVSLAHLNIPHRPLSGVDENWLNSTPVNRTIPRNESLLCFSPINSTMSMNMNTPTKKCKQVEKSSPLKKSTVQSTKLSSKSPKISEKSRKSYFLSLSPDLESSSLLFEDTQEVPHPAQANDSPLKIEKGNTADTFITDAQTECNVVSTPIANCSMGDASSLEPFKGFANVSADFVSVHSFSESSDATEFPSKKTKEPLEKTQSDSFKDNGSIDLETKNKENCLNQTANGSNDFMSSREHSSDELVKNLQYDSDNEEHKYTDDEYLNPVIGSIENVQITLDESAKNPTSTSSLEEDVYNKKQSLEERTENSTRKLRSDDESVKMEDSVMDDLSTEKNVEDRARNEQISQDTTRTQLHVDNLNPSLIEGDLSLQEQNSNTNDELSNIEVVPGNDEKADKPVLSDIKSNLNLDESSSTHNRLSANPVVILARLNDSIRITDRRKKYRNWGLSTIAENLPDKNCSTITEKSEDTEATDTTSDETKEKHIRKEPSSKFHCDQFNETEFVEKSAASCDTTVLSHNDVESIREDKILFLKPGKSWSRSLSLYRQVQNRDDLDSLAIGKGKKWRQSVQSVLDMQQQGVLQSCVQKNEDNNESQSFHGVRSSRSTRISECGQQESSRACNNSSVGSPNRFVRRISIRVVPDGKNIDRYEVSPFLEAYGITPGDNRKTLCKRSTSIVSRKTIAYNVHCEDVTFDNISKSVDSVTSRDVVLAQCNQDESLPFETCYPDSYLKYCRKIGEGVFGEVFLYEKDCTRTVIKIIPIEGKLAVNGERQKKFDEILSEIIITKELNNLKFGDTWKTSSFVEVKNMRCVIGKYPEKLIDLWKIYDEEKNSENDCPDMFDKDQLYIVLELGHGGQDLEAFVFHNSTEAHALFVQTALALAVAEKSLEFEHRDLHWGNILISRTEDSRIYYKLRDKDISVSSKGVKVSVIDFTLSRMSYQGCSIFNDLALDDDLFAAQGEYQFEIYRLMRKKVENHWQNFEPYTNVLWLHYTLDKMITAVRYKRTTSKTHKNGIDKLKELKDEILDYKSAFDFVTNCDNMTRLQGNRTSLSTVRSTRI